MSKLRIITWNIALRGSIEKKMDYLQSVINETNSPTIVGLQEVTSKDKDYILQSGIFSNNSYSHDYRRPGPFDTTSRKLGCMIGVVGDVKVSDAGVINRAPFPDRTLFNEMKHNNILFRTVCFHSLTGVGYKKTKTAQFTGIAEYLHAYKNEPMICCFDANEPDVDHYDEEKIVFFNAGRDQGRGAKLILGSNPVHNMKDAYRLWLEQNMIDLYEIKAKQENAQDYKVLKYMPLTTSHILKGNNHKRYDYIFLSEEFSVENVEYRLEESLKAGSDHAMVVADVNFRECKG